MRSYKQFCSVARALDIVGERWALLVVRDLLLGPQRYSDLQQALPGIGTNVLATRLRDLEAAGVVVRRLLPAPASVVVYELSEEGRDLADVVDALARWGAPRLTTPAPDDTVEPRWFMTSLAATVDPAPFDDPTAFELCIDGQQFTLDVRHGAVTAGHGPPANPAATLTATLGDLFATAKGNRAAARRLAVTGDDVAAKLLVDAITGSLQERS